MCRIGCYRGSLNYTLYMDINDVYKFVRLSGWSGVCGRLFVARLLLYSENSRLPK